MEVASTTVVSSLAADLWDSGSTALRAQLAEGTWNTWFREVRPVRCDGAILVLAVPNAVACERIRSSYTGLLTDLLHDATGRDVAVELVVDTAPRRDDPVVMTPPPVPETLPVTSTPSPVATPGGGLLPGPPRTRALRPGPR